MAFAAAPREVYTGIAAGCFWLACGIGGICYGLLSREFRKGRYGEGDTISSPSRVLLERLRWTALGLICLGIAVYAFRH